MEDQIGCPHDDGVNVGGCVRGGEGMYAPSIAYEIMRQNNKRQREDDMVHLKGIAIGNGW